MLALRVVAFPAQQQYLCRKRSIAYA